MDIPWYDADMDAELELPVEPEIYQLWKTYARESLSAELYSLKPLLRDSWKRSRSYHVPVRKTEMTVVSQSDYDKRYAARDELIQVALPHLHKLYKIIQDDESVIVLTDQDGVVLESIASDLMKAMPSFPYEGSVHSEQIIGTSGIGTCLVLDEPLQLSGAEHWLEINHNWVCSAAPIHISSRIAGTLNLACPLIGKHHEHTLGLVVATVNAIEREIMLRRVLLEKKIVVQQQKAVLEVIDSGVIAIDRSGIITQINQQALEIFNAKGVWEGLPITRLIDAPVDFLQLMAENQMLEDLDISVRIGKSYKHLSFSTFNINLDRIGIGMIIRLRAVGAVRNIVNRASGARAYYTFSDIICSSEAMQQPMRIGRLASKNAANVLILGESGTGKELMAQAIHNASERADRPFIAINCGSLSRELIQSELFGYEGGAFTGAKSGGSIGKFELADGGTLFLDEIGELPLEAQSNLLRVLQTGEVLRIGAKHPNAVDVRIIAATNKDLHQAVQDFTFRNDLFYRLNVLFLRLPPLREREGDIRLVADYLLKKIAGQFDVSGIKAADEVYKLFEHYQWPGNIRELENILQRAVVICETDTITPKELPAYMKQSKQVDGTAAEVETEGARTIRSLEHSHLLQALHETGGNVRKAAKMLGIARGTVYNLVKRYEISVQSFRRQDG